MRTGTTRATNTLRVGAVLALLLTTPSPQRPPAASRPAVALLGFTSSGTPAWISVAVAEMIGAELGADERIRVTPGERVAQVERELGADATTPLSRLVSYLGPDVVVVDGQCDRDAIGGEVRVRLRAREVTSGRTRLDVEERGHEDDLPPLAARLAAALRTELLGPAPAQAPLRSAATAPEARRLHAEGLVQLHAFDAVGARPLLSAAVRADPQNAAAHAALSEAWSMLGYRSRATEEAQRAFELAGSLPREQRLAIEARYRMTAGETAKAVAVLRSLVELFPDDREYALQLVRALVANGNGQEALEQIQRVRAVAAGDLRLDLEEARAADRLNDFPRQLAAADRVIAAAKQTGATLLVAEALGLRGEALRTLGRFEEAGQASREAEALFAAASDHAGRARALGTLSMSLWYQGDFAGAQEAAKEALAVSRSVGDSLGVVRALNTLAGLASDEGRLDDARRLYEQILAIATEVGDRDREVMTVTNIGLALWKQGDVTRARSALGEAMALARRNENLRREAYVLLSLGDLDDDEGQVAAAAADFQGALDIGNRLGVPAIQVEARYGLGRAALARGETREAGRLTRGALEGSPQKEHSGHALLTLGEIAVLEGRVKDALALADAAAGLFRGKVANAYEGEAYLLTAEVNRRLGRFGDGRVALVHAGERLARSQYAVPRLRYAVERARYRALEGRPDEARTILQQATSEAARAGLVVVRLEAALAAAELEADPAGRSARLQAVRDEAARLGLGVIAGPPSPAP